MRFTTSTLFALAFGAPALACVDFHADWDPSTYIINAALTDNGQQKCALQGAHYGPIAAGSSIVMSCIGGYHATIDLYQQETSYNYQSFQGTFGIDRTFSNGRYQFAAKVWGC